MIKDRKINIKISNLDNEVLQALAQYQGGNRSEAIRRALYLAYRKTVGSTFLVDQAEHQRRKS